jgi:hypothetical protein
VPEAADSNTTYIELVQNAIDGPDSFAAKRERIDEYGWRNFGDIYADHEAAFHKGGSPLVSHYNNQYDAIAGFAIQFMRSGDARWWQAMAELAAHVRDIDLYHTDDDKPAYNGGYFWHTFHYCDAGRSTHRAYPSAPGVDGGGPSNEHDYSTGFLLHHFLTGSIESRESVLQLARWVMSMDDGRRTPFRWLSRGSTGLASSTVSPQYHGPGRGAANSIVTLLNAHRLTSDPCLLGMAEMLIRRCVHPQDDIESLQLLDAERRWSYTVFLQALGRYLDDKVQRGETDASYCYAQASLLHYAAWMADHEYPYLERAEILEYPTETWAAQDMRKSDVFKLATLHSDAGHRTRFLARSRFFYESSIGTLAASSTRTLARPVVLLLSNGYMDAWFQRPEIPWRPHPPYAFPPPSRFRPQRQIAIQRAKLLAAAILGVVVVSIALMLAL